MHSWQPQIFDRTCRGLFDALRPMLHHLLAPSLPGYAGKELDRLPTPADCTQLGLGYTKFAENGSYGGDPVYLDDGVGQRDQTQAWVVDR
jgi:hypothetical protein